MTITIEEAKQFITDAEESREKFMAWADRSWNEIKKQNEKGNLWYKPGQKRRGGKYPLWYSTLKIRQMLLLARVPVPVAEDLTPDGTDSLGATAAYMKERLAQAILRNPDLFDEFCFCRDDFAVTNFAAGRVYYRCHDVTEPIRERLTVQKNPETGDVEFLNDQGEAVTSDRIGEDDEGFYLETDQVVDVEEEEVYFRHEHYKNVYIDPDITRWGDCRRVAFVKEYSRRSFQEHFGADAVLTIPAPEEADGHGRDAKKRANTVRVFELHDDYDKEVVWFAEDGTDFIEPVKLKNYASELEDAPANGLYDLKKFFPMTKPLLVNQATDEFWPIPEYYQVVDVLEDINTIFSRMMAVTRAIRARLLYDADVPGLAAALDGDEGKAVGISGLSQSLVKAGGSLEAVVQYIPVEKLIQSLDNLYKALEQRLMTYYQLTGISDLIRGQTDGVERTYGEQQMKEKYAMNQISQMQQRIQLWLADNLNLMCECALKNFSEQSLARYMQPQTMTPDHRARYPQGLQLLRSNESRFRVGLETDSTIALNEEYQKEATKELVNALTTALEKTAQTAATNPALAIPELHALKYLVQAFRQGKLFQDEITQAIDQVIQQAQNAKPPFDAKMFEAQNKAQLAAQEQQRKNFETQIDAMVKQGKLAVEQMAQRFDQWMETMRLQMDGKLSESELRERWTTEERLARAEQREEAELAMDMDKPGNASPEAAPQVVVVQPPPSSPPQTTIVQPVKEVPIL